MKYIFSKNTIHGIGCIALEDFKKGDIVGEEPYLIIREKEKIALGAGDYCWNGPHKSTLLINGLGCYCNHSFDNNIKPIINTDKPLISFQAVRTIKKGDEIFVNYGAHYFKSRNMQIIGNNKKLLQENKDKQIQFIQKNTHNLPGFMTGKMF